MNQVAILLTACINPNGMSMTVLQDEKIREKQYLNALDFYLLHTSTPIVLVENTNYTLDSKYNNYIKQGRLEYITFEGNNYDKSKGKGYGEALIILHAIQNSDILNKSKYIIKITGRIIITNINQIIKSPLFYLKNLFRCDLLDYNFARTVVLIARPGTLKKIFVSRKEEISETPNGFLFENIIYQELIKDKSIQLIPFTSTVYIDGFFATKNIPYDNKASIITFRDNFYFWASILKKRGNNIQSFIIKIIYYCSFCFG